MPVAILYIVANLALGVHLFHGAWSLFQSHRARTTRASTTGGAYFAAGFADADRRRQRHLPDRRPRRRRRAEDELSDTPHDPAARRQDPRRARSRRSGTTTSSTCKLVNPANKRSSRSSSSAPAWPARRPRPRSASSATRSRPSRFHDSPRRAHSIAAQGGINAAKNYQNDGDCIYRLFYDTVKGGDFRAREANVYRLAAGVASTSSTSAWPRACRSPASTAACSTTAPSAARRCRRTFYARGQTGQQLLLGAYQALARQIGARHGRRCTPAPRCSTSSSTTARARGIVARDLVTGEIRSHSAHAVVLATGGYSQRLLPLDERHAAATPRRSGGRTGRARRSPTRASRRSTRPASRSSDEFQSKLTLMSRVAAQRRPHLGAQKPDDDPLARPDPRGRARLLPRAPVPGLRQPRPPRRRLARAPRPMVDEGHGVGPLKNGVYLDFARRHRPARRDVIEERYGNLFEMYERITGEDPYKVPMRIYPAPHYTMGGLWVDYDLMTTVPGLYAIGEANFSDHGANRLGASRAHAGPRRRLLRPAVHDRRLPRRHCSARAGADATTRRSRRPRRRCASGSNRLPVDQRHAVGRLVPPRARPASCGTTAAWRATAQASRRRSREIPRPARGVREGRAGARRRASRSTSRSRRPVASPTSSSSPSSCASTRCTARSPAAGTSASSTRPPDGEALRDDEHFAYVAAWEWHRRRPGAAPKEPLEFEYVHLAAEELQVAMDLTPARLAAGRARTRRAASRSYDVAGLNDEMSFLEMLDLLNERLIVEDEDPIAFEQRLPRGHLRHLRPDDQRPGPRAGAGHRDLPAAHAQVQRRRRHHRSSRGARRRSRSSRTSSSTARRSTASSRPAATSPRPPAARRTPTSSSSPRTRPTRRWTRRRASAAAPAWRPAPTARRSSSPRPSSRTSTCCPRARPSAGRRTSRWSTTMEEYFGSCTNHGECEAQCPKEISIDFIAMMNRDYLKARRKERS